MIVSDCTDAIAMPDWITFFQGIDINALAEGGQNLFHLAQTFEDNLGSDVGNAFSNFIESGQIWALGVGFILGYIVRSFTAY